MRNDVFKALTFENSAGDRVVIFDEHVANRWEMSGRWGFTAPEITNITETYASGITKVLRRIVKPRTCGVNLILKGKTRAQRDAEFDEMVEILMDVYGEGDTGRLYVTRSDGSVVYLNCVYSGGANIKEEYRLFHKFSIEWFGADPYFYRDLDDVFIEVPPSERLTLHDGLYLGQGHVLGENSGTGVKTIINQGSGVISPVLKISRVKGSLTIVNETNGDTIEFEDITIVKGDNLVIDTRDATKTIYVEHQDGTISNASQFLNWGNIEFDFHLNPGENVIKFTAAERSTTEGMTLQLSERYLSA